MDYFSWQARKQGGEKKEREQSDIIDFDTSQQDSIEVREMSASTTVVKRLRRFWTDKNG